VTKVRPPISTHQALDRIAGQLPGGWAQMGRLSERSESVVRRWGDPDHETDVPLGIAIKFDVAFQEAGGSGAPLHDAYAHLLNLAIAERFTDQVLLLEMTRIVAKESGEALTALISLCGANPSAEDIFRALRELPEAVSAFNALLPVVDSIARAARARHPP